MYNYSTGRQINASGILTGYLAIGYNNENETEQNYTWVATWA